MDMLEEKLKKRRSLSQYPTDMDVSEETRLSSSKSKQPPSSPQLSSANRKQSAPPSRTRRGDAPPPPKPLVITGAFGGDMVTLPHQSRYDVIHRKPRDERASEEMYQRRVDRYLEDASDDVFYKWLIYISWMEDIHLFFGDDEKRKRQEENYLVQRVCKEEHISKPSMIPRRMTLASFITSNKWEHRIAHQWDLTLLMLSDITVQVINDEFLLRRLMWFVYKEELNQPYYYRGTRGSDDYDARKNTRSLRLQRLAARIAENDIISAFALGDGAGVKPGNLHIVGLKIPEFEAFNDKTQQFEDLEDSKLQDTYTEAVLNWEGNIIDIHQLQGRFHPRWITKLNLNHRQWMALPITSIEKRSTRRLRLKATLEGGCYILLDQPHVDAFRNPQWNNAFKAMGKRREKEWELTFDAEGDEVLTEDEPQEEESDEKRDEEEETEDEPQQEESDEKRDEEEETEDRPRRARRVEKDSNGKKRGRGAKSREGKKTQEREAKENDGTSEEEDAEREQEKKKKKMPSQEKGNEDTSEDADATSQARGFAEERSHDDTSTGKEAIPTSPRQRARYFELESAAVRQNNYILDQAAQKAERERNAAFEKWEAEKKQLERELLLEKVKVKNWTIKWKTAVEEWETKEKKWKAQKDQLMRLVDQSRQGRGTSRQLH
jgi:hypothetical protein